jgi:hypothetical protein
MLAIVEVSLAAARERSKVGTAMADITAMIPETKRISINVNPSQARALKEEESVARSGVDTIGVLEHIGPSISTLIGSPATRRKGHQ